MLLYALRELDVPLVFINSESKQPAYEELCRSFPRRAKTIFTGPVSEEMLFSAYRAAKVHALPSWFELPGLVSLEAGWMGCNVVTGSWGTMRNTWETTPSIVNRMIRNRSGNRLKKHSAFRRFPD